MSLMDYSKAKDWIVREKDFDSKHLGKCEAIFCLGNGYMGLRSSTEERYARETRNLFVAGMFNKFDENEVTELPNAADVVAFDIRINDEVFCLDMGRVKQYERELNLQTGELTRNVKWVSPKGIEVDVCFKRFVSMKRLHIIGQQISVTPVNKNVRIELLTGIDGRMTNSGSQHFTEGDKRLFDKTFMQYTQTTTESGIDFVFTSGVKFYDDANDEVAMDALIRMERRIIRTQYKGRIAKGRTLVIEKLTDVRTSRDLYNDDKLLHNIREESLESVKTAYNLGYRILARESAETWNEYVWSKVPIVVDSDDEMDQLAIRFAQYHLYIMTPAHDNRMNIGAKGLSGEGYKGHTFWDTDVFLLPYFTFCDPEIARKLVEYRYLTLAGAREKAKANGYEGAMFPWESAWLDDGEVTPIWGAADIITGLPIKILSGFIEQHITSDVAYGVWQYYMVTGDEEFMERYGYELLMDTAKFWVSRLEYAESDGKYHIYNVMGPDEYKEGVDDNAFTNYMAYWNIGKAIDYYHELRDNNPELWGILNERLNLTEYYALWMERRELIFLPQARKEDKLIPQDATYLSLEDIDLTKYKEQCHVGGIFDDYNLEQVNHIQVSKQADIMILFFLMEDMFSLDVKKANWEYYEPRTLHDSSLSLSTHCILANDMGEKTLSYELFQRAREIDLGEKMKSSDEGIHAAALGGIWQSVVYGFGGVRMLNGKLRIDPCLPEHWRRLDFVIHWQGQRLRIGIDKAVLAVTNETNGSIVSFEHKGETYHLESHIEVEV